MKYYEKLKLNPKPEIEIKNHMWGSSVHFTFKYPHQSFEYAIGNIYKGEKIKKIDCIEYANEWCWEIEV